MSHVTRNVSHSLSLPTEVRAQKAEIPVSFFLNGVRERSAFLKLQSSLPMHKLYVLTFNYKFQLFLFISYRVVSPTCVHSRICLPDTPKS